MIVVLENLSSTLYWTCKIVNYDESISGMKKIKKIDETIKSVLSSTNITCSTLFNNFPNKVKPVPKSG